MRHALHTFDGQLFTLNHLCPSVFRKSGQLILFFLQEIYRQRLQIPSATIIESSHNIAPFYRALAKVEYIH